MTTKEERAHHVRQMLANFRLEGIEPDETDQRLLEAYIHGTATFDDLLNHARAYAEQKGRAEAAYEKMYREYEASNATPKKEESVAPEVATVVESFFRSYNPPSK